MGWFFGWFCVWSYGCAIIGNDTSSFIKPGCGLIGDGLSMATNEEHRQQLIKLSVAIKKKYSKPRLFVLGDVRSITLGGSPGIGESGGKYRIRQQITIGYDILGQDDMM